MTHEGLAKLTKAVAAAARAGPYGPAPERDLANMESNERDLLGDDVALNEKSAASSASLPTPTAVLPTCRNKSTT